MMLPDRFFDDMFLDTPRTPKERMDCDIYEEDGKYGIDIDGVPWSNCLTEAEVEDQLYCLFKGIELGK